MLVALVIAFGSFWRRAALDAGFWSDDYLQYAMLHGKYPLRRASWDLFRFSNGSSAEMQRHLDFGSFPYWSHPHFQLSMFRPLASLSRALDDRWFGTDARLPHYHTFMWWALSVCAAAGCLWRLFSPPVALLALLCYALDEAHSVPLVWLSNRSVLMAAAFGFSALWAHVAWRTRPRLITRLLSIAAFSLSLACGEYALSMCGYFLALELVASAPQRGRVRSLAPFVLLSSAFVVGASLYDYGSAHSGIYVSPISEPRRFLAQLVRHVPALTADLALAIPADWWTFGTPWGIPNFRQWQLGLGVLTLGLVALLLKFARPGLTTLEAANVPWLALGAWLSLFPVAGSFVTSRLVVIGSLGAAAVIAALLVGTARRLPVLPWRTRVVGVTLVAGIAWLHVVRAPLLGLETTRIYSYAARSSTAWALSLKLDPKIATQQRVIQIAAFDASDASYLPFIRARYGYPMPRAYRILSGIPCPHRLIRVSERVLDLEILCPYVMPDALNSLTRQAQDALSPGTLIETDGLTVGVLEAQAGQPTRTRFRFDVPLESPTLVFVESWAHGLRQIAPPKLNENRIIEAPPLPNLDLLQGSTGERP